MYALIVYYFTVLDYELYKKSITLCLVPGNLFFSQLNMRLLRPIHDFAYILPIHFHYYLSYSIL